MSRIACVWADLGEDAAANQWYENTHIPDVVGRLDTSARNAEPAEETMFKEVAGIEGSFLTIYELPAGKDAKELDAQLRPALDMLPADARVDTRCYTEHANWFGEEWQGGTATPGQWSDADMWIVVRWQPVEEHHDQFVKWFTEEFAPGMLESPELLRLRIFKLENASLIQGQNVEQKNPSSLYQYLTYWEFDCDELPWEILVYLGSSERWRYYVEGGHLQWQINQYLVNRIFPEDDVADSPQAKRASIILNGGSRGVIDNSDGESDSDEGDEGREADEGLEIGDHDEDDEDEKVLEEANSASHSEPYLSR